MDGRRNKVRKRGGRKGEGGGRQGSEGTMYSKYE